MSHAWERREVLTDFQCENLKEEITRVPKQGKIILAWILKKQEVLLIRLDLGTDKWRPLVTR
jgi:hypothetical protein